MTGKPLVYWVTRDSDVNGILSPNVDVWWRCPTRYRLTPTVGAYWMTEDFEKAHYGRFVAAGVVASWHHAIPDTDSECIRVDTISTKPRAPATKPLKGKR